MLCNDFEWDNFSINRKLRNPKTKLFKQTLKFMAFQEGDRPPESPGKFQGGTRGCLEGNYFSVPRTNKLCLGDFQGKLISIGPPNIKIGVRRDFWGELVLL